jgi:hypothetical protein
MPVRLCVQSYPPTVWLVALIILFIEVRGCNIGPGRYYRDCGFSKFLSVNIHWRRYLITNILFNSVRFQYIFYKLGTNYLIIHSCIGSETGSVIENVNKK